MQIVRTFAYAFLNRAAGAVFVATTSVVRHRGAAHGVCGLHTYAAPAPLCQIQKSCQRRRFFNCVDMPQLPMRFVVVEVAVVVVVSWIDCSIDS